MGKRKADGEKPARRADRMDVDDESDDDSASILNVDFEWFGPVEEDYHGIKQLLRQLFDVDNDLLDLSELTDIILSQPHLGSTVKTDGDEEDELSDPYAFMTILNLNHHRQKPAIQKLTQYLLQKAETSENFKQLRQLLSPESQAQVGLVLSERFINMPHQIVPPLYTQLQGEIASAVSKGEPFRFTHYLVFSKAYTEVASQLDVEDDRPQKKTKKAGKGAEAEIFYFHPEDEVLQKHAVGHCHFEYTKQGAEGASDAKRAFQELGVKPQGNMMLLEEKKFGEAVKGIEEYLGGGS